MLFCADPGFQTPTGITEIEVRHGVRRIFLQAGFKGRARLLVLLLFQEFVAGGKFLGFLIKEGCGHRRVSIKREHRNKYEDLFHQPPPHSAEETIPAWTQIACKAGKLYTSRTGNTTAQGHRAVTFRLPLYKLTGAV